MVCVFFQPIERAIQVILLRPERATGRGDVQHELDAVPRLRGRRHAVGSHHRATSETSPAHFVDGQRKTHAGVAGRIRLPFHRQRLHALESRGQPHDLILLRAPRAQSARALEVGLEDDVARLRLRETRESNDHEAPGETDSLLAPADKLAGTGHAAEQR